MKHALTAIVLVLILTGCGAGSKPAPALYGLRATQPDVAACKSGSTIKIYEPVASPHLDSQRIAVLDNGNKQTFYRDVRWTAPTRRMVQLYLADTFERSQLFKTVLTDDSTSKTKWILESQLRNFEIDRSSGDAELVIRLTANLVNAESRQPVLTLPMETRRPLGNKALGDIVEEFNIAMAELSTDLLIALRSRVGC